MATEGSLHVRPCVHNHVLIVCGHDILHQIYNIGAAGDKDELLRFWGQQVKGHSETGQKGHFGNSEGRGFKHQGHRQPLWQRQTDSQFIS